MKKLHLLIYIMCTCALTACKDDFDELTDSSQRRITFTITLEHFFDNVLVAQGDNYSMRAPATLDANHQLRITAYCYDAQEQLQQRLTTLSSNMQTENVTFRHLDKNTTYLFVFVADVVKSDPYVNYYETWFQLDTRQWSSFYMFSDSRSTMPQHDAVQTARLLAAPANQEVTVQLEPLTYNGYVVLDNANKTDRLTGYAGYVNAFMLKTKSWQRRTSVAYEFKYYNPLEHSIAMPLNLSYADSVVYVKVKRTSLAGSDSILVNRSNSDRRPFVLTIDCESMQMEDCKFY